MGILSLQMDFPGQVGVSPRRGKMITTDNLATITAAGYLNNYSTIGQNFYPTDIIDVVYSYNQNSNSGTDDTFTLSISNGIITLVEYVDPGNVLLPVVADHIATFNGTTGQIKCDPATAINGGNIQAGLSGTAGYLASFPSTASKGSLRVVAANNAGNTITQITNASFGQASVLTIPDPAGATANFAIAPAALVNNNLVKASGTAGLVADAGIAASAVQLSANIKAAVTGNIGGAGAGPISVSVTGMTASSVVVATIATSSNTVSVAKAVAGSGSFDITFSGDPGATCTVNYVAFIAAQ